MKPDITMAAVGAPSLWEQRPASPDPGQSRIRRPQTIAERYLRWRFTDHGQEVYTAVVRLALEARRRGIAHYGTKALCEVVRWEQSLASGRDSEGRKVNNDYTALLAREIMRRIPELDGFFETRQRQVD